MRNEIFRHTIRCGCVMAVLAACLSSGCAQFDIKETFSNPFESEDNDPHMPSRVLAVWVDTIRYTQGQTPTRGFGGRLMFYQHGEDEPVKVEGDLVVYAFDEEGRKPTDPRPTRKYIFAADQLEAHYSKSKVGHSYNFFVPWDEVGGLRKEVSLIVRFQPKLGPPVASEQTCHILPGKPVPEETQLAEPRIHEENAIRAASFQSRSAEAAEQVKLRDRMRTTTIALESRFGQQRPTAKLRPRYTRSRTRVSAQVEQERPETQEQPAGLRADSQPAVSHLRAGLGVPPRRGRVPSTRRLAE